MTDPFLCPIPLWVKIVYTAFVAVLVPAYWRRYGTANFLWFSDLALMLGLAALWLESPLLASMQAVAVLLFEIVWSLDLVARLLLDRAVFGLAEYMYRRDIPRWLRALSLFHLPLPVLLVWIVHCFGYDRRAWLAQTLLFLAVMILCYRFTRPEANINWVFGPGEEPQQKISPRLYLVILMLGVPLLVYLPTHLVLAALFSR